MNYTLIYEKLINRAKTRILSSYTESHHIIPKCMNGTDDKENLVNLTPEEHYVAHQLLVKIHPNNTKLIYAANMMSVSTKYVIRNNKSFGWIRKAFIEVEKNKVFSDETRAKMSESAKRKERIECPHCGKTGLVGNMNRWHFDNCSKHPTNPKIHKCSTERNNKISQSLLNAKWKECTCTFCGLTGKACSIIPHMKLCSLNPNRVKKVEKKGMCPHCGIETTFGNLKRWHLDNCKKRP